METGKVKFFNNDKGFGFIEPDDGSKDIFVHVKGTVDEISERDKGSYTVQEGQKGLEAVSVRKV